MVSVGDDKTGKTGEETSPVDTVKDDTSHHENNRSNDETTSNFYVRNWESSNDQNNVVVSDDHDYTKNTQRNEKIDAKEEEYCTGKTLLTAHGNGVLNDKSVEENDDKMQLDDNAEEYLIANNATKNEEVGIIEGKEKTSLSRTPSNNKSKQSVSIDEVQDHGSAVVVVVSNGSTKNNDKEKQTEMNSMTNSMTEHRLQENTDSLVVSEFVLMQRPDAPAENVREPSTIALSLEQDSSSKDESEQENNLLRQSRDATPSNEETQQREGKEQQQSNFMTDISVSSRPDAPEENKEQLLSSVNLNTSSGGDDGKIIDSPENSQVDLPNDKSSQHNSNDAPERNTTLQSKRTENFQRNNGTVNSDFTSSLEKETKEDRNLCDEGEWKESSLQKPDTEYDNIGDPSPGSPSRESIATSIESNSVALASGTDVENYVNPQILFGDRNNSEAMEDRSFRSEMSTSQKYKPDPPPSIRNGEEPSNLDDDDRGNAILERMTIEPKDNAPPPSLLGDISDRDNDLLEEDFIKEHPVKATDEYVGSPVGDTITDRYAVSHVTAESDHISMGTSLGSPQYTEEQMPPPEIRTATLTGPDNLIVLPRVDENRLHNHAAPSAMPLQSYSPGPGLHVPHFDQLQQQQQQHHAQGLISYMAAPAPSGLAPRNSNSLVRRKIRLRLQEEVRTSNRDLKKHFRSSSLFGTIRKSSSKMLRFGNKSMDTNNFDDDYATDAPVLYKSIDRGSITVSWYDGTSSLELQEHVQRSVLRKLKLEKDVELDDIRILDESSDPPEEIVLSPYIPDGSQFLLRFSTTNTKKEKDGTWTPLSQYSGRPPLSPSAAPSPHPDKDILSTLNPNQLALLNSSLKLPSERNFKTRSASSKRLKTPDNNELTHPLLRDRPDKDNQETSADKGGSNNGDENGKEEKDEETETEDDMMLHSEDPIEARLREITELLLTDRKRYQHGREERRKEKRQVIFVVANYFVLFLAVVAVSAEMQARAPNWLKSLENHLQSVQDCSVNQEALFACVSRGDFAGLIASVLLWLSRSVATRRIFLFGFDTPKKLWTIVYESLVTSICWGISYLFIRRGMNPDTRHRFVQKYWKDAVYGSLAGFNAAFLKQILKNLIPQEVVEDALRERQLKILNWLPSFA